MSKTKFELNKKGVGELMKSVDMQTVLNKYAKQVQGTMGEEFECYVAQTRAVISSKSKKGNKQAMEGNKLLKALGSVKNK